MLLFKRRRPYRLERTKSVVLTDVIRTLSFAPDGVYVPDQTPPKVPMDPGVASQSDATIASVVVGLVSSDGSASESARGTTSMWALPSRLLPHSSSGLQSEVRQHVAGGDRAHRM